LQRYFISFFEVARDNPATIFPPLAMFLAEQILLSQKANPREIS